MAHFSNAIVNGGTFNSAHGDLVINNRDSESGLHTLRLGVSLGAIHDSAERHPPPNCHPDTRKAVRQIILDWIHDESSASSFFWLYGPAGAGKTAILQAIAEFLCNPSGSGQNFGGSFFFSREKNGRDHGRFLFSTIAYQLALKVPGLRQHVNRIMELDPTLYTKSMDVQLRTLIVDAFQLLSPLPQRSYLVIIDGLDECHDKATQQEILRLLCEAITVHKLPLRFLIGSRPESQIRESFDQESLYKVTWRVVLDENFNPGRDIRVFLQDGFAKICAKNSVLSHVERPWPGEGIIDLLVQRSSGQFIYAATVLKFVGADFCTPTKQLALVLKPDSMAFSDLDQLYTQILSVYPSAVNIVQVLGIIITSGQDLPEVIEDILEMEEDELKLVLHGLSSLMEDEDEEDEECFMEDEDEEDEECFMEDEDDEDDEDGRCLNKGSYVIPDFAHASFPDYLFNSSRSGPFHVNRQEYENQITIRSFALIMRSIRSWGMSSITRVLHLATWIYFVFYLPDHFILSTKAVKEAIMTDINDLVQEFWRTSSDGAVGVSYFAVRRLFEILRRCFYILEKSANLEPEFTDLFHYRTELDFDDVVDDGIRAKFKMMFDGYRMMFDQSFSKSEDLERLGDMVRFLPGVVVQNDLNIEGMVDLYRIKPDLLKSLIEPLRRDFHCVEFSYSCYKLDDYLSGFLQDRDRSQLYYCDPMLQHISICRHFLSLLDRSNAFRLQSYDLSGYVSSHFYDHLCAATTVFLCAQNISDDHPAVEILHDLETTAYYVDEHSSGNASVLARCIIRAILRWANMLIYRLKGVAVSVSNVDLLERVCHLTNKIYREILCITRMTAWSVITSMGAVRLDHVQNAPWTPQYSIVLSWDLLVWISVEYRVPCSFTNFITTPELSGLLYISPDTYHTQITEYSLETIFVHDRSQHSKFGLFQKSVLRILFPNWSFREHLSRALPTEMIFYLLRSIRSECLIQDYSAELMLGVLEIIIEWLQGLGSERPSDLYDRFQGELLHLRQL